MELKPVETGDAAAIIRIRNSGDGLRYLTKGAETIEEQREWIKKYSERNKIQTEYYFTIRHVGKTVGTIRIYNVDGRTGRFEWGSWRVIETKIPLVAVTSALIMYDYAFDYLSLNEARFVVAKDNQSVAAFHKNMSARVDHEDATQLFFTLTKPDSEVSRTRWKRILKPQCRPL